MSTLRIALLAALLGGCHTAPSPPQDDRLFNGFYRISDMSENTASCNSPGPKVKARIGRLVRLSSHAGADAGVWLMDCDSGCKCTELRMVGYKSRPYAGFGVIRYRTECAVTLTELWIEVKSDTLILESRDYRKIVAANPSCDVDYRRESFRKLDPTCILRETIVLTPAPHDTCLTQ